MAFKRSWVRFPLSPPAIKNTIYSSRSCRFTCYMWCFFMWKSERAFFKASEKTFQSLQKSVKKIHIRIFTAGIDKLWRMVYTLGANTKFYNQVKAKGTRPERRLLRALGLILIAIPLGVLLLRLSPQSIAKCALSGCEAIASG